MALHYLTLTELAASIEAREVSPVDVVEHLLERIARVDVALGAYVRVTGELARRQAQKAQETLDSGRKLGPLHGVPVAVKDLCDTEGVETAAGMAIFAGRVPTKNAAAVQRLLDAGAILLGKVKTTEGASSLHHPSISPPVNPWSPAVWTGVSSSGSGVATAAGLCFGAIGTDTAGSIRFPSAANAVVGLKPTFDLVPTDGVFPFAPSLDHVGPMARSVRDVARMLGVLANRRAAAEGDVEGHLPLGVKGLRIGVDSAYCTRDVDGTLSEAVLAAARHLESLGAEIHAVDLKGVDEAVVTLGVILHADTARVHAPYSARHDEYGPHLRAVIEIGERLSEAEVVAARESQRRFKSELERLLMSVDVMLCPPAMTPPPPADLMRYVPADFRDLGGALRYTAPYNLARVPTLTLPCGFTAENVPLALQLVARPHAEGMLLRVGQAYEETTEWHLRHPLR